MDELTKIFTWIIDNPSWKKAVFFIVFIAMVISGVAFYEYYTASFRLARIQKEAELLTHLRQIPIQDTNIVISLAEAQNLLITRTEDIIKERPLSSVLVIPEFEFSKQNLWNFLAGAIFFWVSGFILSMKGVFSNKEGDSKKQRRDIFLINLLLGVFTGFLGMYIPHIWWPWFHIFIYPFLFSFGLVLILIPIIVITAAVLAAREKAQSFNCINNLRQINAAKHQWALENEKTETDIPTAEEIMPYLKGNILPKCPTGGEYIIGEIRIDPTCSRKGHAIQRK